MKTSTVKKKKTSKGWALQAKGKNALSQTHLGNKYKEENAWWIKDPPPVRVPPVRSQQPNSYSACKTEHNRLLALVDLAVAALS